MRSGGKRNEGKCSIALHTDNEQYVELVTLSFELFPSKVVCKQPYASFGLCMPIVLWLQCSIMNGR